MKNRKFLFGGIIIGLAIVALGIMAFLGSANSYYFTVREAIDNFESTAGETIRIQGEVAPGYQVSSAGQKLDFTILHINEEGVSEPIYASIDVEYTGAIPNNFETGRHVVVEGKLDSPAHFTASKIITACASKYEPA